jgi:hypothetical protein
MMPSVMLTSLTNYERKDMEGIIKLILRTGKINTADQ